MTLRSRAPLRVSFAGGGTDVSPYAEEHGGAVLNATFDSYAYASLSERDDSRFVMRNLDQDTSVEGDLTKDSHSGVRDLATAAIKRLGVQQGFELVLHSDAPWGSGLGSSSTHVVAVVGAFSRWMRLGLSSYELAEIAYEVERLDLELEGGRQDQYSATFGGFNFMEFNDKGTLVNPLRISPETVNELHYRLVLCFLGGTRLSSEILRDQIGRYKTGQKDSIEALHRTKELAYSMKRALLRGYVSEMGELLHEGWEVKKRFSSLVTNPEIDQIYEEARRHGAIGGKLLGAGGGGHMILIAENHEKVSVISYLTKAGVAVIPYSFEFDGLTTWRVNDES